MQALSHAKMCRKVEKLKAGKLRLVWAKSSAKFGGGLAQKRLKEAKSLEANCRFPDVVGDKENWSLGLPSTGERDRDLSVTTCT